MQFLGDIVRHADLNYGLGRKAQSFVLLSVDIIYDSEHGGTRGMLKRLREAGLGASLDNWLNANSDDELQLPDSAWVDQVIGRDKIARIGRELGLANARVRSALAYVVPALFRSLSSNGELPGERPQNLGDILDLPVLSASRRPVVGPVKKTRPPRNVREKNAFRWFWTLGSMLLLLTGFYLGRQVLIEQHLKPSSVDHGVIPENPVTPVTSEAQAPIDRKSSESIQDQRSSARLVIRSFGDRIEYVGFLDSEESRRLVLEKLEKFFGSSIASGDLIVDPGRLASPWLQQLDRLFPLFNVPGIDVRLDGSTVRVGGWLTDEDRAGILNSLMSVLGSSYRFGYLRDEWTERSQDARQLLLSRLSEVKPESRVQDVVPILNRWVVHFDEGSPIFPSEARDIAERIVEVLKTLKETAVLEIQVHVASAGSSQKLSMDRANAVRDVLVKAGWPATLLKAKGVVETKSPQSTEQPYQAARSERLEFRVIHICDPLFPCEISAPTKRQPPVQEVLPGDGEINGAETPSDRKVRPSVTEPDQSRRSESSGSPASSSASTFEINQGSEAPSQGDEEGEVSRLKSLDEPLPSARPKPRVKSTPKPASAPNKESEWYDPFGLF